MTGIDTKAVIPPRIPLPTPYWTGPSENPTVKVEQAKVKSGTIKAIWLCEKGDA